MQHKFQIQRGLGFGVTKNNPLCREKTSTGLSVHFAIGDLPNVDAVVGAAQADDFGARRSLDQVVDLAIWDEILVIGILGEERKFELFRKSLVCTAKGIQIGSGYSQSASL
jgi:hypothetical protein